MTSELTLNESPDDSEMPLGYQAGGEDEQAIAAILAEAYDAPSVPRALTKRIDVGIAQQWGHSPGLVVSGGKLSAAAARTRRIATKSFWLAGGLAATVMFAFVVAGGSSRYAWAAVVAAMREHGLVRIAEDGGDRWLDVANGIACEQNDQQTTWIDLRRNVALSFVDVKQPPRQVSLRRGDGSSPSADDLLAVFLLGEPLSAESLNRFGGTRVVEQNAQVVGEGTASNVELRVRLSTSGNEQHDLSLLLDPQTQLPLSVISRDSTAARSREGIGRRSLIYSKETTDQLRDRILPTDGVIELASGEQTNEQANRGNEVAVADASPAANPSSTAASGTVSGSATDMPAVSASDSSTPDSAPTATESVASATVGSLPIGAASRWKPVALVRRSDAEVQDRVDEILDDLWQRENLEPVQRASDVQLLRRAYLDLAGRTPSVTEVRAYLNDTRDDRYPALVERLLDSPDHASQMAAVWRSFLIPEGVDLEAFGGREAFEKWLSERFAANEPYDQTVRALLLAEGRLSQSGPLLFYSALKLDADQLAARTSRVFLGMRLECAQCHDHPFEPWSQKDFWSYAAFFARISRPKAALENVSTVMRVQDVERGEVMLPESEDVIEPRFLGQSAAENHPLDADNQSPRRQRLARWLTGADNPYFARATVNRVWSHLFGRGIVDPVDDFGENNQPVSPELLDTLASQFIDSGFDLKTLIRTIALSQAYQLSSSSSREGDSPEDVARRLKMFAQMNVKTLTAEQLYDCIAVATLLGPQPESNTPYALSRFGNSEREQFLQQFAAPSTSRSEYLAGIPQALMLMNGTLIAQATGEASSGLIQSLDAPFFTDQQRIEVLFMATLSRPARPDELDLMKEFLPSSATDAQRRAGLADLLWALVNSSEFTLNH
ncbi:MAG: DUF1553 domain-containing protein [Pirellulaceae bacterium]